MTKVNPQNWEQLNFLINNFYEIVEYKRGRGIYGDRVILRRPKQAECVFGEPNRLYEFYYMDANAVKELPRTIQEKINIITRFVVSPEDMNVLCEFNKSGQVEPNEWAIELSKKFAAARTLDFKLLNDILIEEYRKLDSNFLTKLKKHREKQYFLASSDEFNFITKEFANQQINVI
ncbi:MAG: hypothetical protein ACI4L6_01210 [Candidatus Onthoplasma sp.]